MDSSSSVVWVHHLEVWLQCPPPFGIKFFSTKWHLIGFFILYMAYHISYHHILGSFVVQLRTCLDLQLDCARYFKIPHLLGSWRVLSKHMHVPDCFNSIYLYHVKPNKFGWCFKCFSLLLVPVFECNFSPNEHRSYFINYMFIWSLHPGT